VTKLIASMEDFALSRGVDYDPTDMQALIALEGASGVVRAYTGQLFDYVEDEEILLNGSGTKALLLPQLPVIDVTEVALVAWDATETILETTDYVLGDAGILYRGLDNGVNVSWGWPWWAGARNIRVVYSHGYTLPGEDEATGIPDLPSEISLVTMQIAARNLTSGAQGGQTVASKSVGSYSVTYETGTSTLVDEVGVAAAERLVLDKYRVRSAI
jgi:hypothetical protein